MTTAPRNDVAGEYAALRGGVGVVVDRLEAIWVRGPDAVTFLQATLTQDLTALSQGDVTRAFLLSPKGKIRTMLWVLVGDNEVVLLCDVGFQSTVIGDLMRFKLNTDATVDAVLGPVLEVIGPDASSIVGDLGYVVPESRRWAFSPSGELVATIGHIRVELARYVLIGPSAEAVVDVGAVLVGHSAAEAVRIEAGEPVMGSDVSESTLVHEVGVLDGSVSFTKGCYLGQEIVERIDSRGRVNKRIVGLVMESGATPPSGAAVFAGGESTGEVTSVAESVELDAPIALAMVRHEVPDGAAVQIRWQDGETSATLHELPIATFGEGTSPPD